MRINKSIKRFRLYAGILLGCGGVLCGGVACTSVKPFQKARLNDFNMKLGKADIEKMDENMQTYREGASGGGNGKPSGGCGCN